MRKKSLKGWVGKAEYTTPGTVEYEAVQAEKLAFANEIKALKDTVASLREQLEKK